MYQIPTHWFKAGQEMFFHISHFHSCGNYLSLLQQSLQIVTGIEKVIHCHWQGRLARCFSKWTTEIIRKQQNLIKINTISVSKSNTFLFDTTSSGGNNTISLFAHKPFHYKDHQVHLTILQVGVSNIILHLPAFLEVKIPLKQCVHTYILTNAFKMDTNRSTILTQHCATYHFSFFS